MCLIFCIIYHGRNTIIKIKGEIKKMEKNETIIVDEKETEQFFFCEICGELTPIECEGSAPCVCEMCLPKIEPDNFGYSD